MVRALAAIAGGAKKNTTVKTFRCHALVGL
jgi:hypothetical protein